jgi:ribosomal protein L24E
MGFSLARRAPKRRSSRAFGAALVILVAAGTVPWSAPVAQAQVSRAALTDPPANVPRTRAMALACSNGPQPCQEAVVQAIDQARAAEGIGPLELPSNYDSITTAEQLLVLANLERIDRGLPGFIGLSSRLDTLARSAALVNNDPKGPSDMTWGSNWAGGEASAVLADYDWMYDDGPGSPNMDCTSALASGCWDHRRNVLGNYGPHPGMGAAMTMIKGVTSMTELFTSGPPGQLDYAVTTTANSQLVAPGALEIGTTPGVANSATLTVRNGGGSLKASASVSGDGGVWSVTPSCQVSRGALCHLVVTFVPRQAGPAAATVTVKLADRSDEVGVNAYAGHGYWEATKQGEVFAYAGGGFRGSAVGVELTKPVVGMSATPDGGGYWEVDADGGVFTFGDAKSYGSAVNYHFQGPIVGIAVTPDGKGYWLVARNGNVFSFGDARFSGPTAASHLDQPVVGIVAARSGNGYWLVTGDGNVFSFGSAKFYGPTVQPHLTQPVVGMARTNDGNGYWLVSATGTVLSFGDAKSYAPAAGAAAVATIGIAAPVDAPGYYLLQADGAVLAFGGAPVAGNARGAALTSPIVAMATA